ncbi:MAG: PEP-CTERM sorting domain-containing protein [Candidatus Acidiferrales bacterium]
MEVGNNGSFNLDSDHSMKPVNDQGDVLFGIQNNSGSYFDLTGYKGPNNIFSGIHLTGGLDDGKSTYFETDGSFDDNDGEDDKSFDHKDGDSNGYCDTKSVTPEPSSILLLGTGLIALWGVLRRKLLS